MDLWVVAAATGAGYLAKYLQNLSGEKEEFSESSSGNSIPRQFECRSLLQQARDQTCALHRLAPKKGSIVDFSSGREDDDAYGNYEISDIFTLPSLPPGFRRKESMQENAGKIRENKELFNNSGVVLPELKTKKFTSNKPLRSKRADRLSIRPLNPLESFLTCQLNREEVTKEEYVLSSLSLPSAPSLRPLLVTDGNLVSSRAGSDSFIKYVNGGEDRICLEEKIVLLESELCQGTGLVEFPRSMKHGVGKGKINISGSGGPLHSQGSPDGMLLFFAGISIGIISSFIAHKRELDSMNAVLKQTDNLIQDLHEELEMKEKLTVKEIYNEDSQSPESVDHSSDWGPAFLFSKQEFEESMKHGNKESNGQNVENPELMSKIEAELKAELEKLELNINSSGWERISDFVELDPDFEADVVHGDLKVSMVQAADASQSESNNEASGTSTNHTHSANYGVLPWDLSLRLHEVIESRLKARIKELESALRSSQKRVHSMEWLCVTPPSGLAHGEVGSSATPESQTCLNEINEIDRPLAINLMGKALDAYNEACEEIIRLTDSDGDTPSSE